MVTPTCREEKRLRRKGFKFVAGLDEAGRGAWAGPIVAAAVIMPLRVHLTGLRDSKQLSPRQRDQLYKKITRQALSWSVGIISQRVIDRRGIGPANILAMIMAIKKLSVTPDYLLIDALKFNHSLPRKAIVRGDQKIVSIAAASILAKVTRDRILIRKHEKQPIYGFNRHKGYGTKYHYQMLKKHGVTNYHRLSFLPMKELIA